MSEAPAPTPFQEFPTRADHDRMFRWDVLRTIMEESVKLHTNGSPGPTIEELCEMADVAIEWVGKTP